MCVTYDGSVRLSFLVEQWNRSRCRHVDGGPRNVHVCGSDKGSFSTER